MHRVLERQLRKLGMASEQPPNLEQWQAFLERVERAYTDADRDRYTIERSLELSSGELQALHEELAAEHDRLQALIGCLGEGLCVIDPEGKISFANPEAELLLGYASGELSGKDLLDTVSPPLPLRRAFPSLVRLATSLENWCQCRDDASTFLRADGSSLPVSFTLNPIVHDAAVIGAAITFRDMSPLLTRNDAMRRVLDNVDQALATVRADGTLDSERSAAFDAWLGSPGPAVHFAQHLASSEPDLELALRLGWEMLMEGEMPLELCVEQLKRRFERGGAHYTLSFKPILREERVQGALLMISDVTAEVEAQRGRETEHEYVEILERLARDRGGFFAFWEETDALLGRICGEDLELGALLALMHTVKGNAAQWGVTSVSRLAHAIESAIVESRRKPTLEQLEALQNAWTALTTRVCWFGSGNADRVELSRKELDKLLGEIGSHPSLSELARRVDELRHEPVAIRFQRLREQLERLAERCGKPKPGVRIEPNDVRLPSSRFAGFWAAAIHAVRNIVDHGLETEEQRKAAGKSGATKVTLRASVTEDAYLIEFSDDGRGVRWNEVADKLAAATGSRPAHEDLERALLAGGVSTAHALSEVSGRGVGLAALAEQCAALGGTTRIESSEGQGTRLTFTFPRTANQHSLIPAPMNDRVGDTRLRATSGDACV